MLKIRKLMVICFYIAFIAMFPKLSWAQNLFHFKDTRQELGSVLVNDTTFGLFIDFKADSAFMGAFVSKEGSRQRYIPLILSVYRGLPKLTMKIMVSKSGDEIWVYDPDPELEEADRIFAYYRLGSDTATSKWGTRPLLDTPDVQSSSRGKFPEFDIAKMKTVATFYFSGEESPLPVPVQKGSSWK